MVNPCFSPIAKQIEKSDDKKIGKIKTKQLFPI